MVFVDFTAPNRPVVVAHWHVDGSISELYASGGWVYARDRDGVLVARMASDGRPTMLGRRPLDRPGILEAKDDVIYFSHHDRQGVEVLTHFRPDVRIFLPAAYRPSR